MEPAAAAGPGAGRARLSRVLPFLLILVVGAGASLALFLVLSRIEADRARADFASLASDRANAIRAALAEDYVELGLMASYVSTSEELSADALPAFRREFAAFIGHIPDADPDTLLLAWVPRVTAEGRAAFEAAGRSAVDREFAVLEWSPGGEPVPAGKRAELFPLLVAEPSTYGAGLTGLDLSSVPVLVAAMAAAAGSDHTAASGAAPLPLRGEDVPVTWLFRATYDRPVAPGARVARADLRGFVAAALRIDFLVDGALKGLSPAGLDFTLSEDPSAGAEVLYVHRSRSQVYGTSLLDPRVDPWAGAIDAGGRTWVLTATAAPGFLARHRAPLPWVILGAGLLLTGAGGAYFAGRLRRALRVEQLVAERTLALADEVEKHRQLERDLADSRAALAGQVDRLSQRSREIQLLNEMSDTLQACVATAEAYPAIALYLPQLFPGSAGALSMRESVGGLFAPAVEWGSATPLASAFKAEDCWALRRGRMHATGSVAAGLRCAHVLPSTAGSTLCIPVSAAGRTLGLLHLSGAASEAAALAVTVADRVGLSLSNLMLRTDLQQLAIHDPLTGLFNRRYMEEALALEVRRAERKQSSIAVIMLDIDHFKAFNDGFGHAAGDELLRSLGALVTAHLRGGDIACRYGGEEFVLILPEATAEVAGDRAEELREHVREMDVRWAGRSLGRVTISLGVALFPAHAKTAGALLEAADACLYEAKGAGRDRVVLAAGTGDIPRASVSPR